MTTRIRDARLPADADSLAQVYISTAEHHQNLNPSFYRVPDLATVVDRYRTARVDGRRVLLVADAAGQVVGSASITLMEPPSPASMLIPTPTATLDVAVLSAYRGRGIGTELMRSAENRARQRGAKRILLDMAEANIAALAFYRSLGYDRLGLMLAKAL